MEGREGKQTVQVGIRKKWTGEGFHNIIRMENVVANTHMLSVIFLLAMTSIATQTLVRNTSFYVTTNSDGT